MKLNEIAATKSGLVLNRKKATLQSNIKRNYSVVSLKSFNSNGVYNHLEAEEFIAEEELKDEYIAKKGDILIRLREPNYAVYINEDYEDLLVSSLIVKLRVNNEKVLPEYLTQYINSDFGQKQFFQESTIGALKMIKVTDIQNLEISIPSLEKQKLIVETMNTFNQEEVLLNKLIAEKQKLKQSILNTVIKEDK